MCRNFRSRLAITGLDKAVINTVLLTCREDTIASYQLATRAGFICARLPREHIHRGDGTLTGRLPDGMTVADYQQLAATWS